MPEVDIRDVTLASADPTLLSCWEEKVKQGVECSLVLKHSKGKIVTTLSCSVSRIPDARSPSPPAPASKPKKRRKRGGGQKRLEALLSYQQRLVQEKGLPPSRLMLQHAAVAPGEEAAVQARIHLPTMQAGDWRKRMFKCDLCDFYSSEQQGVSEHMEKAHNPLSTSCTNCEKSFASIAALKVHSDAATVYCHSCQRCMNDDFNPDQLISCTENEHGLEGLRCYYEDAEDPEWWMIFTCDPSGDPDRDFDYLKQ